jgi:hypothetical protein
MWSCTGLARRTGTACRLFATRIYSDYTDDLDSVDALGAVSVPTGPGLGVTLDEEWIARHLVDTHEVTAP